jgi:ATP/maltotriose-dependent transcriptional regulator MalT
MLYAGLFYKEIANKLNITLRTAKWHGECVHKAWGIHTKKALLQKMVALKLLESSANPATIYK